MSLRSQEEEKEDSIGVDESRFLEIFYSFSSFLILLFFEK